MSSGARWKIGGVVFVCIMGAAIAGTALRSRNRNAATSAPAANIERTKRTAKEVVLAARSVSVAPGVHMLGSLYPSAVYVIETAAGLVLVDSGFEAERDKLVECIAELGLDPASVVAVLLTHAHGDHSMGALHLRRETGAKIYAGRGDAQVLRDGGPWEAIFSKYETPKGTAAHATPVDVELTGGEMLTFGESQIEVLATPGHTPGSVCYLLERNGLRLLFSGDTLMTVSAGVGTYSAALAPRYRGDAAAYLDTLHTLSSLTPPDMLLPGHPRLDSVPRSPRISPAQWKRLIERGVAELEQTIACLSADGADFLDGMAKELLPGLYYLGDLDGRAVYFLATPAHTLLFGAPGGDALAGWVDAKLVDLGLATRAVDAVLLTTCEGEAISGLPSLVTHGGCRVVAAAEAIALVRALCPPATDLVTSAEFEKAAWIDLKVLPLADVYPGATAYVVVWEGAKVLFSGRMPIERSASACRELGTRLGGSAGAVGQYRESLYALRRVQPQIWLPAMPLHCRNANLYDQEWDELLRFNIDFARHVEEGTGNAEGAGLGIGSREE
jgi:glyoxylase-like metal-dependent hydrolase (beta-lactamase superfamily II)